MQRVAQRIAEAAPATAALQAFRAALKEEPVVFGNNIMNYGTAPIGAKKFMASTVTTVKS